MSKNAELRDLIWQLIKSNMPVFDSGQSYEAVVKSVNMEELTCEVSPPEHQDITITARLSSVIDGQADSCFVVFPTVDSTVIVSAIKDDPDNIMIVKVREVLEVRFKIGETSFKSTAQGHVFDGGELGGMCITPELKTQLDKMSARIDAIDGILTTGANGAGTVVFTGMALPAYTLPMADPEDFSEIENDKVMH